MIYGTILGGGDYGDGGVRIKTIMTEQAHIFILWAIAFLEMTLAIYIFFRYQRSESIISLVGILVGFALMTFFVGDILRNEVLENQLLDAKAAFTAGALIFISFFRLALWYPSPTNISRRTSSLLTLIPLLLLFIYTWVVPGFVENVRVDGANVFLSTGPAFFLFIVVTTIYFIAALYFLIRKIPITPPPVQKHLLWLTVLMAITGSFGIIANNIFPLLGKSSHVVGPEGTGFVALLVAVIVLKK